MTKFTQPDESKFHELLEVIKAKYTELGDQTLSIEKHTLVQRVATETGSDPIDVANTLAWYENARNRSGFVNFDVSNDHLLVIKTRQTERCLYFSVTDILRLVPPIHVEPSPKTKIGR